MVFRQEIHQKQYPDMFKEVIVRRDWIQKFKSKKILTKRKIIAEFIIDQTDITVGSTYIYLWITIEPTNEEILAISLSCERKMHVTERFISKVVDEYGKYPDSDSSDGGSWYPQVCKFLKLNHHIHSSFEKSIIEMAI
jgi:putative transposase